MKEVRRKRTWLFKKLGQDAANELIANIMHDLSCSGSKAVRIAYSLYNQEGYNEKVHSLQ